MTPKEKAEEVDNLHWNLNYEFDGTTNSQWSKEAAIIDANNTLDVLNELSEKIDHLELKWKKIWYESVIEELEKL
jgi:hypothetical protein